MAIGLREDPKPALEGLPNAHQLLGFDNTLEPEIVERIAAVDAALGSVAPILAVSAWQVSALTSSISVIVSKADLKIDFVSGAGIIGAALPRRWHS